MLIAPVVYKVAENLNWHHHVSFSVYAIIIGLTVLRQWWTDEAVSARYGTKVATKSSLYWVVHLFLIVIQGRGKLRPFVKRADKTVVRVDKKVQLII